VTPPDDLCSTRLSLHLDLIHTITGLQREVGGSLATVADLPFASRRFLSDLLLTATGGSVVGAPVVGPGAEVMAQQAAKERCVHWLERRACTYYDT